MTDAPPRQTPNASHLEESYLLGEVMVVAWGGRWLILGAFLVSMLVGRIYAWRSPIIYRLDAMLQIEGKKSSNNAMAMVTQGVFETSSEAAAEIEIISSNLVLGRTVDALSLQTLAVPRHDSLFSEAWTRIRQGSPARIEVEFFEAASGTRGQLLTLVAQEHGSYRLLGPKEEALGVGQVGQEFQGSLRGAPLRLKVRSLSASPGQAFTLQSTQYLMAIQTLRASLTMLEKGAHTNIIGLSLNHTDPARGAEILNTILAQYVRQNIERKAEEASKTLAFLNEQMPLVKGRLDVAEERLNSFRVRTGSVDLGEETKLLLQQGTTIEAQVMAMRQKREELLRSYQETADPVANLNRQILQLQEEGSRVEREATRLPHTQQEILRLMRDVQVNQELHTSLHNSSQRLQVAKAGEIGNARIVDQAIPSLYPILPRRQQIALVSALLGLAIGAGLAFVRRLLSPGIHDPHLLETHLNLPVLVTIPHSSPQEQIHRRLTLKVPGAHLLALSSPEDMAIESLRSLRTSLYFTLFDATNNAVLITGPSPSIGKSFVSTNFAAVLAQPGKRVLLVDADMRRGTMHASFGRPSRQGGLSEVLAGQLPWRQALYTVSGVEVLSSGTIPPNPAELLMSSHFDTFIQEATAEYDHVIIDAPPVLAVTDAALIGKRVGAVLLLVKAGKHSIDELRTTLQRLEVSGVKVRGFILNDVPERRGSYRYYRYAYHYAYGKK